MNWKFRKAEEPKTTKQNKANNEHQLGDERYSAIQKMVGGPDSISRPSEAYRIPELLQDIRLLDLLELSGSTVQASRLLSLSQPTVSRRYRLLAQDFGLLQEPRQFKYCRYGTSEAMRWLRLGCRAHRLEAGVVRIGTDLLHQPLLAGVPGLLTVPARFRSIHRWVNLVREGVLDAALVSGLEIHPAGSQIDLGGLQLVELGSLPLTLAVRGDKSSADSPFPTVLLPMRSIAAGLHRALQGLNLSLRAAGHSCNSAEQWLQRLNNHGLAIPIYHHPASWAFWCQQLSPLPLFRSIEVGVGLLLPDEVHPAGVLLHKLEAFRQRIHSTKA
jgi:hypothetical protein